MAEEVELFRAPSAIALHCSTTYIHVGMPSTLRAICTIRRCSSLFLTNLLNPVSSFTQPVEGARLSCAAIARTVKWVAIPLDISSRSESVKAKLEQVRF